MFFCFIYLLPSLFLFSSKDLISYPFSPSNSSPKKKKEELFLPSFSPEAVNTPAKIRWTRRQKKRKRWENLLLFHRKSTKNKRGKICYLPPKVRYYKKKEGRNVTYRDWGGKSYKSHSKLGISAATLSLSPFFPHCNLAPFSLLQKSRGFVSSHCPPSNAQVIHQSVSGTAEGEKTQPAFLDFQSIKILRYSKKLWI